MIPGVKKRGINFADILMYLALALKHHRLIILLFCLSLTSGLVYYVYARPVYYSRALIQYKYLALPVDTEKVYQDSSDREFLPQLTSPHIIERTAKRLGIKANGRELDRNFLSKITTHFNSERN